MTLRRITVALLAAVALAGCGGDAPTGDGGSARLLVTRDRGATLLLDVEVAAGQSLMRGLRGVADVEASYGGQFVDAIEGIESDASRQRDWFWFVNGILGDRSAASYRLHGGDVAWWDYREWEDDAESLRVVVGVFPEPFLHGFDGVVREAAVRHAPGLDRDAARIAEAIGAEDVAPEGSPAPAGANVFVVTSGPERFVGETRDGSASPSAPVRMTFAGSVDRLLAGEFERRLTVP